VTEITFAFSARGSRSSPIALSRLLRLSAEEDALLLGRGGARLSKRSVDDVVRRGGNDAGRRLSPPVLRRTCLTTWCVRGVIWCWWRSWRGIGGWTRPVDTALPSTRIGRMAMEGIQIDF
jgi:hypothetical protein